MSPDPHHPALRQAHRVLDAYPGRAAHRGRPASDTRRIALVKRLLSFNAGVIDKLTLRLMEPIFLSGDKPEMHEIRSRLDDAKALYAHSELLEAPGQFFERCSDPPRRFELTRLRRGLPGGKRLKLTWESTYRTWIPEYQTEYDEYRRNVRNYVHLWRHDDAQDRHTLVCIHPWCLGFLRFEELVFAARSLYKLGLNVALFTMPFHGRRTPKQALFPGQLFPSRHIHRTNEAFGQSIADLKTLLNWLRGELQVGPIGMTGFSLGGYTTALMASLDPSLDFAIPIVAPATFADLMWTHGEGRPQRRKAEEQAGLTLWDLRQAFAVHSPLMHRLQLPRDRTLIVWGTGDTIVPSVHQLALWEHWGRPEIRSFHGGHMLHFGRYGRRGYLRVISTWLKDNILQGGRRDR